MTPTSSVHRLLGVSTALITPMRQDGSVDFVSLKALVHRQIEAGVTSLVACGTTAESATLTEKEREAIIVCVIEAAQNRVPIIVGTGTQSTPGTLHAQKPALALGAYFGLVVTPFYNKPTQAGMVQHIEAVAQGCELPIILYNVPSRTAVDLTAETVVEMARLPQVVGIKDATGDILRPLLWRQNITKPFAILSGDDATLCPFLMMGGDGVISVASHVAPKSLIAMCEAVQSKDFTLAKSLAWKLAPLCKHLFTEPSPIPIKAALARLHQCENVLRLPLLPMTEKAQAHLFAALEKLPAEA